MNTRQLILVLAKEGIPFSRFCSELKRELRKSLIIRSEVINRIAINDAMIQATFEERKNKYSAGPKCRLEQVFLPFTPDSTSEQQKALRLKMDEILLKLRGDGELKTAAEGDAKDAALTYYGDMGWIQLKDMASPLADAVRKLKEGEISEVIESAQGLHIIKLVSLMKESGPTLDELKESLRKELFEKEFQKRYKTYIQSLRDAAHIEIRR